MEEFFSYFGLFRPQFLNLLKENKIACPHLPYKSLERKDEILFTETV